MDHHTLLVILLTASVFAVVIYGLAPLFRHHVYRRLVGASEIKAGAPSGVCKGCGTTTARFTHVDEGGILCHRCNHLE